MCNVTPLPQRGSSVYRPHGVAGEDRTPWAALEDVAVGGGLCLALWFFTSLAFLA